MVSGHLRVDAFEGAVAMLEFGHHRPHEMYRADAGPAWPPLANAKTAEDRGVGDVLPPCQDEHEALLPPPLGGLVRVRIAL
eukprot:5758917-Alexandrium_andersonii.AAC.1